MSKWKDEFCEKHIDCKKLKQQIKQLNVDRAISKELKRQQELIKRKKVDKHIQKILKNGKN